MGWKSQAPSPSQRGRTEVRVPGRGLGCRSTRKPVEGRLRSGVQRASAREYVAAGGPPTRGGGGGEGPVENPSAPGRRPKPHAPGPGEPPRFFRPGDKGGRDGGAERIVVPQGAGGGG